MYSLPSSSSSSSIVLPVDASTSSSVSGSRISSKKFPAPLPPRSAALINKHNKSAGEENRQYGHRRVLIHLEGAQRAATIVSEAVLDLSAESESESENPNEESTSKKIKAVGKMIVNGSRTQGTAVVVNEEKAEEEADRKWITNLIEKGTEADLKHREALIGGNRMIGERMRKLAPTVPVAPPMMRSVKNGPKRVAKEENIRDKLMEEIRRTGGVEGLRRRGQVNGNT